MINKELDVFLFSVDPNLVRGGVRGPSDGRSHFGSDAERGMFRPRSAAVSAFGATRSRVVIL